MDSLQRNWIVFCNWRVSSCILKKHAVTNIFYPEFPAILQHIQPPSICSGLDVLPFTKFISILRVFHLLGHLSDSRFMRQTISPQATLKILPLMGSQAGIFFSHLVVLLTIQSHKYFLTFLSWWDTYDLKNTNSKGSFITRRKVLVLQHPN